VGINLNIENKKKIYGWARHDYSLSYFNELDNIEKIDEAFNYAIKKNLKVALRANGKSYGDNSLNDDNIILRHTKFDKILNFDTSKGIISVQSGITLDKIINYTVPLGWIFHVCPAHRYITVSGSLSNNVHGKNCFQKGYFGDYVEEFTFYSYSKGILKCSRNINEKYFYSIISGIGILGLILEVKIKLKKINSFYLSNQTKKFNNIESIIEDMEISKEKNEFNIGSLDATKYSNNNLAGIMFSSNFLEDNNLEIKNYNPNALVILVNYLYMIGKNFPFVPSILNQIISFRTKGGLAKNKSSSSVVSFAQMNFLNDMYVPKYNYFFKNGFIEYQVVFNKKEALGAFHKLRHVLKKNNTYSLLSSFKAYKKVDQPYLFGLNKDGYCISFDVPYDKNLNMDNLVRELNEVTIKFNGQVYLAKTPCINSKEFNEMYTNLDKFKDIKKELDPNNIIQSNLSRRLGLDQS
jgi:FAD/FMN-containing dehydrogenase